MRLRQQLILSVLFRSEYNLWMEQWAHTDLDKLPKSAIDTLNACSSSLYPTLKQLLQILCTLPVSVAYAERSFSCVRRLKTWMRSRMGADRLTGLALMHVHRDISVSVEDIINRFANAHTRKLDFVV